MTASLLLPDDEPHPAAAGGCPARDAAGSSRIPDDGLADNALVTGAPFGARVVSAGGLVFRRSGDALETLLCALTRPDCGGSNSPLSWRLPKGTPQPGESLAETARREVREETGINVHILAPITSIRYSFLGHHDGIRYDKTVHFYLMKPLGGSTADHDAEFDIVEWRPYEQALHLLEYDNERGVLETARPIIDRYRETGPL